MSITIQDKLSCIEREIAMRRRVYPRFIVQKRMTVDEATREIAIMEQIFADYETIAKQMDLFERD